MKETQPQAGSLLLDETCTPPSLIIKGEWTLPHYPSLENSIQRLLPSLPTDASCDLQQLTKLDTAGATLLVMLLGEEKVQQLTSASSLPTQQRILLETDQL